MAYPFKYDLSKLPKKFSAEIARIVAKKALHKRIGELSRKIVKKFKVETIMGIYLEEAISLIEDLIDVNIINLNNEEKFKKLKKKILLLPHCARKYMDNRCKAKFVPEYSSYFCQGCSKDCLINQATKMAKEKNYQVFVLPGGSGVKKILKKVNPEGVIGVACLEELKLGEEILRKEGKIGLLIPLTKNGCAHTEFNLSLLKKNLI